ncbi:MAG: sulfotransferase, partial [Solirubrobacterales bacterium]
QGKSHWGDKTPTYVKTMRRIKRVLPEASFIHVVRDGRDVTLSNNKRIVERGHRDPVPAARAARQWRNRVQKAQADGPKLGKYLEIRYEDLVLDTESTLRRVCECIDLEFEPGMLRYHETASERLSEMAGAMPARDGRPEREAGERLKAHALATKPPTKERIEVWRDDMSAEDQAAFERVAGDLLDDLGYARAQSS